MPPILLVTALAPAIWGSSYIVSTQMLPNFDPLSIPVLRALPAGLLLLLFVRRLPRGVWIWRMLLLGALNFAIFWTCLFIAAYRLPGGIAAVLGSLQPFIVIFAAHGLLGTTILPLSLVAAATGMLGVAMLILTPAAELDLIGIIASIVASASMALGTVLSRKWQPPVPALTFTAWQLTAGGLLLIPVGVMGQTDWGTFNAMNLLGLIYLGLIGAALTYVVWLRGVAQLPPAAVSILGLLSPVTATLLGWLILGEALTPLQALGMAVVLGSVLLGQYALRRGVLRLHWPFSRRTVSSAPR